MNRRFDFRPSVPAVSRLLIALGLFGVAALSACGEKLEAGAACPLLCPATKDVDLKDTTVDAVAVDTSIAGFPVIGEEEPLLLAARGDTLDTRVIFRFDSIGKTFPHPTVPADTIVTHVDSATLRVVLDTATVVGVPRLPTQPVTIELYDVDSPADTVAADLLPLFTASRLLGSKTFAPESLAKDTLFLPVAPAAVLGRIINGTRLRIGLRLVSATSTQLRIASTSTAGALLRFKPAADTAVSVPLFSKTPTDSTLATLRSDLRDYVITAKGVVPPPANTISVGGYPARRTFLRFDLPSHIVDSSTVVRATLTLTQYPMRGSPNALDSLGIYPFAVTAGTVVTDVSRLLRLVTVNTVNAADSLRVVPADSGTRRLELVNLVRVWRNTKPELTQRALVLAIGEEGVNPAIAAFFASEAPIDLRPRLQLTYVPKVTLGLP
jgi:hypothetical protein